MSAPIQNNGSDVTVERARGDLDDRGHCTHYTQVLENYKHTAVRYEQVVEKMHFSAPVKAACALDSLDLDRKSIDVIDVGAGTGLVGVELSKRGYAKVTAVDGSEQMLDKAREKQVYKDSLVHVMGTAPMPFQDDTYDVAVISGCFLQNFMPMESLQDIIRVVKPGGYVINVGPRNEWVDSEFDPYLASLTTRNLWQEVSRQVYPCFLDGEDGCVYVFKVL